MILGVSFTACIAATVDASSTSPLAINPFLIASAESEDKRSNPVATALLSTIGLCPIGTIPSMPLLIPNHLSRLCHQP